MEEAFIYCTSTVSCWCGRSLANPLPRLRQGKSGNLWRNALGRIGTGAVPTLPEWFPPESIWISLCWSLLSYGAAEIKWVDLGTGILNPIYERELNKPDIHQA